MSTLSLEVVSAGYSGSSVVRDVTLSVSPGEIVLLLGANGAGKTTLLKTIAGLLKPTSGSVALGDDDITAKSPRAVATRGVGYVPDDKGIFRDLTVEEHFRLGWKGKSLHMEQAFERFPELRRASRRRAGLLSGGEQQMLALSCALARAPRVLLIDEMSMGLAPRAVEKVLPVLRVAATEERTAVLLVEQGIHRALASADRCYVLAQGKIVLEAPASEVRSDSSGLRAAYLGEQGIV